MVPLDDVRKKAPPQHGVAFVITLWLEPARDAAPPEWRWRVTEAQSGEQRYFRRVIDLLSYVSERADVPPPS